MANGVPQGLFYSKEHEWAKVDGDVATIGITDYAQSSLGDIVYVELPRVGAALAQHASPGVVESVKAVSDIYSPVGGEVVEINAAIEGDPALVNRDPYGEGWLFKIKLDDVGQTGDLLSPAQYQDVIKES